MRLAVFGDVHGHLGGVFEEVSRLEEINQTEIDAILQSGDLSFRLLKPFDIGGPY